MKNKYRMFRSGKSGYYYWHDNYTGKQGTLGTQDKREAQRLLNAKNESHSTPTSSINLQIARSYLLAADPKLVARTWQEVMERIVDRREEGPTKERWQKAIENADYDWIRKLKVVETRPEDFDKVLKSKKPSTNAYLRRIHNFALGMDWLLKPVIPRREWPPVVRRHDRRGITAEEHQKIIEAEAAAERRNQGSRNSDKPHYTERLVFYELCWHLGGSQSDIADLHAEDVDWTDRTIGYGRCKLKNRPKLRLKNVLIHFGDAVAQILRQLPSTGPLFPYLRTVRPGDRATEFAQRCKGLGIHGVSLHSYRYAWAGRARQCGYPRRFAEEALGHNSKAVHHAYASKTEVKVPSLETWAKQMQERIVEIPFAEMPATGSTSANKVAEESGTAQQILAVRP